MEKYFDTVLMNPPFGTKSNAGIDLKFLRMGTMLSSNTVYSLHKSTTRLVKLSTTTQYLMSMEIDSLWFEVKNCCTIVRSATETCICMYLAALCIMTVTQPIRYNYVS